MNKGVKKSGAFKKQVGGSHYKGFTIEPFEFFFMNNLPFHKAIIKRILRYDMPTGGGMEDLEKIKHEIDMIIELEEEKAVNQKKSYNPSQIKTDDILKIYGNVDIPGDPEELEELRQWTKKGIEERGEAWVKENASSLLSQWEWVLSM